VIIISSNKYEENNLNVFISKTGYYIRLIVYLFTFYLLVDFIFNLNNDPQFMNFTYFVKFIFILGILISYLLGDIFMNSIYKCYRNDINEKLLLILSFLSFITPSLLFNVIISNNFLLMIYFFYSLNNFIEFIILEIIISLLILSIFFIGVINIHINISHKKEYFNNIIINETRNNKNLKKYLSKLVIILFLINFMTLFLPNIYLYISLRSDIFLIIMSIFILIFSFIVLWNILIWKEKMLEKISSNKKLILLYSIFIISIGIIIISINYVIRVSYSSFGIYKTPSIFIMFNIDYLITNFISNLIIYLYNIKYFSDVKNNKIKDLKNGREK